MIPYCGECIYLKYEDTDGYGVCDLTNREQRCSDKCWLSSLKTKQAIKVLHDYQKWRRGGKGDMIPPYIIGMTIDEAIRTLRTLNKEAND